MSSSDSRVDPAATTLAQGDTSRERSSLDGPTLDGRSLGGRTRVLPPESSTADHTVPQRFEALRTLGAGGMGEVALVRDRDIGRTVALKRPLDALDEESLQRFAREVRTVGRLEHPCIVPVHDVGVDDDGRHYFVMKYVEGETLRAIIDKLKAGDPAYLARYTHECRTQIFTQLLHAVEYAHAKGVLHRDIKPDNVMVGPYGEVMLMDWGIARELGARREPAPAPGAAQAAGGSAFATAAGSLLGTPAYMSPEQARGEIDRLDERSDVYSLCVVFHELLSLHHYLPEPKGALEMVSAVGSWPGMSFMEWMRTAERRGVPAELIHFLRFGMNPDPAARYPNVRAALEELGRVRDRRVPVRCQITFIKHALGAIERAINREPRLATLALVLLGVGFVGGVYLLARALLH